jgi:hypothetical protein
VSANLDLVRSIYADWERGEFKNAEWAHAGIEYRLPDGPSPDRCFGRDAMAEAVRGVLSAWRAVRLQAEEYRTLDGKHVLVLTRTVGFESSELEPEEIGPRPAHLFHIEGDRVTRLIAYFDRDHAFADLGLTPGGAG